MVEPNAFVPLVSSAIARFQIHEPNSQQVTCIHHPPEVPLRIVAGPGSGKTTVLVLRALRLVFVDGRMPEQIVLTTFTRKAAEELRARLIEWGSRIKAYLVEHPPEPTPSGFNTWLDSIDVNRFVTGTLDSICEEILTTHRDPTAAAPVLVEGFVGNGILMRHALFPLQAHNAPDLDAYTASFTWNSRPARNFGEKVQIWRPLLDRFIHDLVDIEAFRNAPPHATARDLLATCAQTYQETMSSTQRMDFALLEETFLQQLQQGRLTRFTDELHALLVDEYQDTNPLQERIYFTLIQQTGSSLTIVGDDDQALYRFRGATVELFRDFPERFAHQLSQHHSPVSEYLYFNYRSTPAIVEHFNAFIQADPAYQGARVEPPKPEIVPQLPANGVPILGMFRADTTVLADGLGSFLWDVFRGNGRTLDTPAGAVTIARASDDGDFGDAVLLSHTVREFAGQFGNMPPRERLPSLLRARLAQFDPPVAVFNPRGRLLRDIPVVQCFLGTILNCIDPGSTQQGELRLRTEAGLYLTRWRQEAEALAQENPAPRSPHTLPEFVAAWQSRTPQAANMDWPSEWPLLELGFKLLSWMPLLRDDPEGQVYLEAVSRCIAQAATFSPYRSTILYGNSSHDGNSVKAAIRDILAPIAEASIDVDEDIMPHVPRSRFPIMTIHQAKGLEFPLVIVDVASDYRTNHQSNRFRRFPDQPSAVPKVEDDFAPFCEIGPLRQVRDGLQRSFDDLVRLYYVAYSRAQCVLMLVGLDPCLRYQTTIRHVATGWTRDGSWSWRAPVTGLAPPLVNSHPLLLI